MAFLLVRKNNSQTNLDLAQAFILTDQWWRLATLQYK
jgi:hypothetical protein